MTNLELPELDLVRRELEKDVVGKKMKSVEFHSAKVCKPGGPKKSQADILDGVKIKTVNRKGTTIVFGLDNEHSILVTLGEGANLQRVSNKAKDVQDVAVDLHFTQTGRLLLVDPNKESQFFTVPNDDVAEHIDVAGLDLIDEPVSWTKFGEIILRQNSKLKIVLMDPEVLVGIGPVYSDEILFESGLRYDRMPESLSTQEIRRLYRAAVEIIHDSIKHGGASIGDSGYRSLTGEIGGYTSMIKVYGKDGGMSPRARGPIGKARVGGVTTYFCEQTQV